MKLFQTLVQSLVLRTEWQRNVLLKEQRKSSSQPRKKAEVVAAVTQSLRTRKILEKHGLMKSPEEENKIVALKAMASDFPEGIKVIKNARSNNALEALGAVKTLSFGKNVKK